MSTVSLMLLSCGLLILPPLAAAAPGRMAAREVPGGSAAPAAAKRKVFIDQDGTGPVSTNMLSMLALLQAPDVEVLGISITAGDTWAKEGVRNTLRMLELTGHASVPVAQGAEHPLINSPEEVQAWEAQFGAFTYKGAWNARGSHEPGVVPPSAAGDPSSAPVDRHGANFLIETVRKYPGEVTVWAGAPLTTIALALRLDPELPGLAKELVMMGSGFNVDHGGLQSVNGRREFNWWFDPEAARIVMSAPWKKITITPVDISVKTFLSDDLKAQIARAGSATARYITKFSPPGQGGSFMWDEIAAIAFIDPSLISRQQDLYVNVDIGHGPSYGQTIFLDKDAKVPSWWKLATVQWDLDTARFYRLFVDLMSR
jgi:purine nucleosidase